MKILKKFRSHGIERNQNSHWHYDISKTGFNYRLSDINCALGLSQITKLKKFIQKRKKINDYYLSKFKRFNKNLVLYNYSNNNHSAYHLFLLGINFKKIKSSKKEIFSIFKEK